MKLHYLVKIEDPKSHIVKIEITGEWGQDFNLSFFLPSWSPGSYLMREYARHVRSIAAFSGTGEPLYLEQKEKGVWNLDISKSSLKNSPTSFSLVYEVYCHELTVRTSHIDESHAFLHGPTYLMGILQKNIEPTLELRFPPLWSKVTTTLNDISTQREIFKYSSPSYDELIDTPIEIGCHETDGFLVQGKEHTLAFYGIMYPHNQNIKKDIEIIVNFIASMMGEIPYARYAFITHLTPNSYGGLEHLDSCVLNFDGRKFSNRKEYIRFLSLVAHEYFHLYNVKRIRPKELGPFNYLQENYTSMLWLAEGLTSFVDDWVILQAGLCTKEEYLDVIKDNLNNYFNTVGRKFHSLEQSSFNAWIKLYRPDENSNNSSISYYLKGGLVFLVLHILLETKGKSCVHLLSLLWERYKKNPLEGLQTVEVFQMVEDLGSKEIRNIFETMVTTTEEIDFEKYFALGKINIDWEEKGLWMGIQPEYQNERVFIRTLTLDSPAVKAGANAGDEILFLNGLRVLKNDWENMNNFLKKDVSYQLLVSRLGSMVSLNLILQTSPRRVKKLLLVS
ncbi:MAG: hypothetical protein KBD63_04740 [Bacteriovoracaceae bacterium]|nr:hypothetical protein [Bacteriovoracaceae bacterium]